MRSSLACRMTLEAGAKRGGERFDPASSRWCEDRSSAALGVLDGFDEVGGGRPVVSSSNQPATRFLSELTMCSFPLASDHKVTQAPLATKAAWRVTSPARCRNSPAASRFQPNAARTVPNSASLKGARACR